MEHTLHLTATVTADSERGGYVARAVEVEVASQGDTIEEALINLREALELRFEGEDIPEVTAPTVLAPVDIRLSA